MNYRGTLNVESFWQLRKRLPRADLSPRDMSTIKS